MSLPSEAVRLVRWQAATHFVEQVELDQINCQLWFGDDVFNYFAVRAPHEEPLISLMAYTPHGAIGGSCEPFDDVAFWGDDRHLASWSAQLKSSGPLRFG